MKKNFKKLVLNKSTLSNLDNDKISGGKPTYTPGCVPQTVDLVACSILKCVAEPKPTRDCPTIDLVQCSVYKCEVISKPK